MQNKAVVTGAIAPVTTAAQHGTQCARGRTHALLAESKRVLDETCDANQPGRGVSAARDNEKTMGAWSTGG